MNTLLPIVVPSENADPDVLESFSAMVPGSVAVAIPHEDGALVYYEGGVYIRNPDVPPTHKQRENYAILAAGRASQNYPTIAKFFCSKPDQLKQVGSVNTQNYEVRFNT